MEVYEKRNIENALNILLEDASQPDIPEEHRKKLKHSITTIQFEFQRLKITTYPPELLNALDRISKAWHEINTSLYTHLSNYAYFLYNSSLRVLTSSSLRIPAPELFIPSKRMTSKTVTEEDYTLDEIPIAIEQIKKQMDYCSLFRDEFARISRVCREVNSDTKPSSEISALEEKLEELSRKHEKLKEEFDSNKTLYFD